MQRIARCVRLTIRVQRVKLVNEVKANTIPNDGTGNEIFNY